MRIFQSALPRGERPIPRESSLIGILFQSALPRGERLYNTDPDRALENFNPRSREGSDTAMIMIIVSTIYFNPRSREGSDSEIDQLLDLVKISIRAPARGATSLPMAAIVALQFQSALPRGERRMWCCQMTPRTISIRAPARGATSIFAKKFSSLLAKIV